MDSMSVAAMKFASHIGSLGSIAILLLFLWIWKPARRRFGLFPAMCAGAAILLGYLLKRFFGRIAPETISPFPEIGGSFPSGHALDSMALYALLAVTTLREAKDPKKGVPLAFLLLLLPVLIGVSRVRLGFQYPGNVLAGWMIGFLVALIVDACKQFYEVTREIREKPPS